MWIQSWEEWWACHRYNSLLFTAKILKQKFSLCWSCRPENIKLCRLKKIIETLRILYKWFPISLYLFTVKATTVWAPQLFSQWFIIHFVGVSVFKEIGIGSLNVTVLQTQLVTFANFHWCRLTSNFLIKSVRCSG